MAYDEPVTKANFPVFGFEVWDLGRTAFKVELSMEVRWAHAGDLRMAMLRLCPWWNFLQAFCLSTFWMGTIRMVWIANIAAYTPWLIYLQYYVWACKLTWTYTHTHIILAVSYDSGNSSQHSSKPLQILIRLLQTRLSAMRTVLKYY